MVVVAAMVCVCLSVSLGRKARGLVGRQVTMTLETLADHQALFRPKAETMPLIQTWKLSEQVANLRERLEAPRSRASATR